MTAPIVMVSSYPPRLCGIATFCEEAREFIARANPDRAVLVVSHFDGAGEGVLPAIDISQHDWWKSTARMINDMKPHAVHVQHEYGLYEYIDRRGDGDGNQSFLSLIEAIKYPIVVEPHTVHGRLREHEENFVSELCQLADVVLLKCHYQKWRLDWVFSSRGWKTPRNLMVLPHGARPDRRWSMEAVPEVRRELGLDAALGFSEHVVGMIGWIQSNKRWDIFLNMWEEVHDEILRRTGQDWTLLAAGAMRDPNHREDYHLWVAQTQALQERGIAHYYEFIPRGEVYYKMLAVCDFVVLPSVDETQSGTLARVISLNKPFVTSAPMEGLTAQTLESEGGLLFTNREMLRRQVLRLACDEQLRLQLGHNLVRYLDEVVSWEVVARQYNQAYELAHEACRSGTKVELPLEF